MSLFQDLQDKLTENGVEFELKDSYFSGDKNKAIVRKFNNVEIMIDFADMTGEFFDIWTNEKGEQIIYENSSDTRLDIAYQELTDPVAFVLSCIKGSKAARAEASRKLTRLENKERSGKHVDYMELRNCESRVKARERDIENYENVLNELGK